LALNLDKVRSRDALRSAGRSIEPSSKKRFGSPLGARPPTGGGDPKFGRGENAWLEIGREVDN